MALCNKCWKQVAPGSAFCENCGAKVEEGVYREKKSSAKVILPIAIVGVAVFLVIAVVAGIFIHNNFFGELSDEEVLELVRSQEIDAGLDELKGMNFGQVLDEVERISHGEVNFKLYCNEDIPIYTFLDEQLDLDECYYVGIDWNYYNMFKYLNIAEIDKDSNEVICVWKLGGGWEDGYFFKEKESLDLFAESTYVLIKGYESIRK